MEIAAQKSLGSEDKCEAQSTRCALGLIRMGYMNALRLRIFPLSDEKKVILFDPETLKFLAVSSQAGQIIKCFQEGLTVKETGDKLRLADTKVKGFINAIEDAFGTPPRLQGTVGFNKLSLHVSHLCNMRCTYCYASGGDYGLGEKLMSKSVALAAVNMVLERFGKIRTVQFFGGEPLLNLPVIEAVCEYVTKELGDRITLGLVTNLSILPEQFVDLVRRFNLKVTVSLDGPKEINDLHRIFRDGSGTYEIVASNIRKLKRLTNQPVAIEATITEDHRRLGYTKDSLVKYFSREFGISAVIPSETYEGKPNWDDQSDLRIAPALSVKSNTRTHREHEGLIKDSVLDVSVLKYMLPLFAKTQSPYWCGAGLSQLSVTPTGDIYPCQLFLGHEEYRIGNVVNRTWNDQIVQELRQNSKLNDPECKTCPARWACTACLAAMLKETGSVREPLNPRSEWFCRYTKLKAEQALNEFIRLLTHEIEKKRVVETINKILV